jgi:hypothetical protein
MMNCYRFFECWGVAAKDSSAIALRAKCEFTAFAPMTGPWLSPRPADCNMATRRRLLRSNCIYPGRPSTLGRSLRPSSQQARLSHEIRAWGRISGGVSRQPAGTTSRVPSICRSGSAEPQVAQKLLPCRVPGSRNERTRAWPESQETLPPGAKILDAWAEPVSLRQREQWHRKKCSNAPSISNVMPPQRHAPFVFCFTSLGLPQGIWLPSECERISAFQPIACSPPRRQVKEHGSEQPF